MLTEPVAEANPTLAAQAVQKSLIALAIADKKSPLFGAKETDVAGVAGHLQLKKDPAIRDSYLEKIMA